MKTFVTLVSLLFGLSAFSQAEASTRVGILRCYVDGGPSFIVGSSHEARCVFTGNGKRERYAGRIKRFGLDVGYTGKSEIVWAVLAPSDRIRGRALVGSYVGASADASIVVGGGANLLVGGSDRTVSLQPLSVQGETGLALGLGVGDLELR